MIICEKCKIELFEKDCVAKKTTPSLLILGRDRVIYYIFRCPKCFETKKVNM